MLRIDLTPAISQEIVERRCYVRTYNWYKIFVRPNFDPDQCNVNVEWLVQLSRSINTTINTEIQILDKELLFYALGNRDPEWGVKSLKNEKYKDRIISPSWL